MKRLISTTVLALATALAVTGCGSDDSGHGSEHDSRSTSSDHNAADVEFLTGMVPHHQQAVQMAAMAKYQASSAELQSLAAKIEAAQDPEIETMQGWLKDWGEETRESDGAGEDSGGMHHGSDDSASAHAMGGMMSQQDMSRLEAASGAAFDRMFLQMMVRHHEGAVEAAKTVQDQGKNAQVKALAERIEAAQKSEITQMQELLSS